MFLKFFGLFVTICVCFGLAQINNNQTDLEEEKRLNDTIIELFNNCSCIPYPSCPYANKYMFVAKANIIPKEIACSDPDYVCCIEITTETTTKTEVITTTETTPEVTTTLKPKERNIETSTRCGEAKTQVGVRILTEDVESAATIPGEVPWMVEIFQKSTDTDNPYKFKCSGSLIHPKVVLTATHCIVSNVKKPDSLKVVATGGEVFQAVGVAAKDERNVSKVIKHPEYYSGGLYNDIALLVLHEEYSGNNLLNSICLPNPNQTFDGRRCIATGWGRNKDLENIPLQKVDLPVVNFQECQNFIRKARKDDEYTLHSSFTCAGGEEGKDTCKGDGGAPLMCLGEEYEFVQVGIVSWGVNGKCGIVGQPGVYTNVGKFSRWIKDVLLKEGITIN